jgi:hypothetical protein
MVEPMPALFEAGYALFGPGVIAVGLLGAFFWD